MKCRIEIDMDNAAFEDDPGELARILRHAAKAVEDGVSGIEGVRLYDVNGNRVGSLDLYD